MKLKNFSFPGQIDEKVYIMFFSSFLQEHSNWERNIEWQYGKEREKGRERVSCDTLVSFQSSCIEKEMYTVREWKWDRERELLQGRNPTNVDL